MSWLVVTERTPETMQPIIDDAPPAFQYCIDGFSTYETLNYHHGLHLVAEGKSVKEIAHILAISNKTVEFHKASIMDQLGIRTTAELTRYAIENGIVKT